MNNYVQSFIDNIYTTHNDSSVIQKALSRCFSTINENSIGLNIGAGSSQLHPSILNLDIAFSKSTDCVANAEQLPFADNTLDIVVTQETLEHVKDPFLVIKEINRVLKPNGILYCQVPFTIGYHPGPTDYWRFSVEGIQEMVERTGLHCDEVSIAVGPGTGFYRIVVEFWAVLFSVIYSRFYRPVKGIAALVFYPIKLLDPLLIRSPQANRIAGGYFVVAHK